MRVVACVFGSGVYFANTGRAKYLLGYVLKSVLLCGGFLGGGLAALALRGPYVMWSYVAIRCVMSCYVNMVLKFAPCCAMLRYAVVCYVNVALDFVRC